MEATKNAHESTVKALCDELKLRNWGGGMMLTPSADPAKAAFVKLGFEFSATADEVRAIHAALVSVGLIKI
jgi:hypothetical protein